MRYMKDLGDNGENFAANMLEDNGFNIIERNYRSKSGEIDIIAIKEGVLHFIEVKTRTSDEFGTPAEAVTETKIQRIRKTAESYICRRRVYWRSISFDVFEVTANLITGCM